MVKPTIAAGLALACCLTAEAAVAAQGQTATIRVTVLAEAARPVEGATVSAGRGSTATDASGLATLVLPPGPVDVIATKDGHEPATARVDVVAGSERLVRLVLTAKPAEREGVTGVSSTRSGQRSEDQAVPVEVISQDTIEQKMPMTPGGIVRLFSAMGGLRVQTTSPELGTAMVRMQGLRGQYTRLLSDGVPLYWDHPGGLGLIQIPPGDLSRVEVIKGASSAIYGSNAFAGVVNLLSRRPGKDRDREFLFSQSARGATDGTLWISSPATGSWSHTFLASVRRQEETDVDGDGWSDLPGYQRGIARQRVYWDNGRGRRFFGTAGAMYETREGGSAIARQSLDSKGADGVLSGQMPLGRYVLSGSGTLFVQWRDRESSDGLERERRESATIELALRGKASRHTWVAGIATDWYALRSPGPLASTYSSTIAAIFVHDDVNVAPWLTVSGSARLDHHITYGFFMSPRGSALVRSGPWSARISAGRAFFGPTALTEETEAAGLAHLSIDAPLRLETARSVSADVMHETRATAVKLTLFQSHIDDPAVVDRATYTLRTGAEPVETRGAEILATARRAPFALTGTYTYVHAREHGRDVALTPRHSAGLVAAAEGNHGRVSVDIRFTGAQRLDANPYRSRSEPYVVLGLLGERGFGRWRLFVNAENLTDVRQTNWDPIARPARDVDGRWTVDAWAPLAGRLINAGLKISF